MGIHGYTIPETDDDGELRCERYDHDAGEWVEGGEPTGLWIVRGQPAAPAAVPQSGNVSGLARRAAENLALAIRKEGFKGDFYQAAESLMDERAEEEDDHALDTFIYLFASVIESVFAAAIPETKICAHRCDNCEPACVCFKLPEHQGKHDHACQFREGSDDDNDTAVPEVNREAEAELLLGGRHAIALSKDGVEILIGNIANALRKAAG